MSKKECYVCDMCGKLMQYDTEGVLVKGNIYLLDGKSGIIGNNFPTDIVGPFTVNEIRDNHLCFGCIIKVLEEAVGCMAETIIARKREGA